jgi:hypothetical protein
MPLKIQGQSRVDAKVRSESFVDPDRMIEIVLIQNIVETECDVASAFRKLVSQRGVENPKIPNAVRRFVSSGFKVRQFLTSPCGGRAGEPTARVKVV